MGQTRNEILAGIPERAGEETTENHWDRVYEYFGDVLNNLENQFAEIRALLEEVSIRDMGKIEDARDLAERYQDNLY